MIHNEVEIDIDYEKYGIIHKGNKATITTYIKEMYPNDQNAFKRPLIVICPGGGYEHHSPREAEAVAIEMLSLGFNALVLRYSLAPDEFPCALFEAAYTLHYAREHAKDWDINPDRIIIAGFSAGGHVAASLGTMWNGPELEEFVKEELGTVCDQVKPNGLLLGYPVITSGVHAHNMSFQRLLGNRYEKMLEQVSLENRVTESTPNTFIWHTFADATVPVENSMLFAAALRKVNVKFELHIFPDGSHGLGLASKETDTKDGRHNRPEVAVWTELFKSWVENTVTAN